MPKHIITCTVALDAGTANRFQNTCLQAVAAGASELEIHLSCPGGSTFHGFTLYHVLRTLPIPVTIYNVGNIESMGIIVYLAATTRKASPHSRFLLHALNWGFGAGTVDHARLREYVATLDNDLERFAKIFEEATAGADVPADIRRHLAGVERILSATEAVESGLANEVAAPEPPAADVIRWWVTVQ